MGALGACWCTSGEIVMRCSRVSIDVRLYKGLYCVVK